MTQDRMPLLFVGHGSPMNAVEDNAFTRTWQELGERLPRPRAILCISAHFITSGLHAVCDAVTFEVAGTGADWLMLRVPDGVRVAPPHLTAVPVPTLVNAVARNGPELIEPVGPPLGG